MNDFDKAMLVLTMKALAGIGFVLLVWFFYAWH